VALLGESHWVKIKMEKTEVKNIMMKFLQFNRMILFLKIKEFTLIGKKYLA